MDLSRDTREEKDGGTPRQEDGRKPRRLGVWGTAIVLVVAALVGLLLWAAPLHLSAEAMEESSWRSAAVAVTGPMATASDFLGLDRPWEWATGYEEMEMAGGVSGPGSFEPPAGAPAGMPPGMTETTILGAAGTTVPPGAATGGTVTAGGAATTLPAGAPVSTATTGVTGTTTTTEAPKPVFTAEDPLRVLVVGDSLAVMMGYGLMRQAEAAPALRVEMVTKVSSGLSRPDFYNWPQVLVETVAWYHPHVTVILFGGNDKQTIRTPAGAFESFSDEWFSEYYRRIWAFLDTITNSGSEAVWMGLPIMRSDKFAETCRTLNSMYGAACESHRSATYIDGYALFEDEQGKYNAYLLDSSGERRLMRAGDGIHFSNTGGDRQAEAVMEVLLESYRLEP